MSSEESEPEVQYKDADMNETANTSSNEEGSEDNENNHEVECKSYVGVRGDWETRQISIIGVVKRFISQLSYGQDLTKISLPSEFLNPYSVLELASMRYLTKFSMLLEANEHTDPQFRMLYVVRWFLAGLVDAKMYKKPYNPVVGETHKCHVQDPTGTGTTKFVAEQVTHHPPVSAMYMNNSEAGVTAQGSLSFAVKFWFNSVTISTLGFMKVKMAKHGDEIYSFSKCIPDLQLKNVVFGTRRMKWQNSIKVECKKTNCTCEIFFDDSANEDLISGQVLLNDEPVITFEGALDGSIYSRTEDEDEEEERLLLNSSQLVDPPVIVPPQTEPYPSIKVWRHVSHYIINNNMTEADRAKQEVEEEQRKRTKMGEDLKKERTYFIYNEQLQQWVYKENSLA